MKERKKENMKKDKQRTKGEFILRRKEKFIL